jgi:hypothetical protein
LRRFERWERPSLRLVEWIDFRRKHERVGRIDEREWLELRQLLVRRRRLEQLLIGRRLERRQRRIDVRQ